MQFFAVPIQAAGLAHRLAADIRPCAFDFQLSRPRYCTSNQGGRRAIHMQRVSFVSGDTTGALCFSRTLSTPRPLVVESVPYPPPLFPPTGGSQWLG